MSLKKQALKHISVKLKRIIQIEILNKVKSFTK